MKCQACNKSLQDETAVAFEGKVYCFECFKKVEKRFKALKKPTMNKMVVSAPNVKSMG